MHGVGKGEKIVTAATLIDLFVFLISDQKKTACCKSSQLPFICHVHRSGLLSHSLPNKISHPENPQSKAPYEPVQIFLSVLNK
jgi:hypothetical protein